MLISLFTSLHNRRVVGKIVGNKLMTSLLVSSRNAGNLKLFGFKFTVNLRGKQECFVWQLTAQTIGCLRTTQNPKLANTFKFTQDSKLKRESKHLRVCAELFTEGSFEQTLTVRSLLGLSFKPRRLALKKTQY